MEKSFSQACENNKRPILDVIGGYFNEPGMILEIGTGSAQHAMYFAEKLRNLYWQTSDKEENIEDINAHVNEYTHYNLGRPLAIDVLQNDWQLKTCEGIFSANTAHIMNWQMVKNMFEGVGNLLLPEKYFCLYGPFTFNDKYTSSSNETFDKMLKEQDPQSGLKNFEELQNLADSKGLNFFKQHDLPANNHILVWQQKKDS